MIEGSADAFPCSPCASRRQKYAGDRKTEGRRTEFSGVIITTTMGKVTLAVPTAAAITPATEIGDYTLVGDYYIPDLKLPEESRPIGRWGRMHKAFLQEHRPGQYNELLLSGKLWTYLADLNEQADDRLACIISQMQAAEGVSEELKICDQLAWVGAMNSIRIRAEEIIRSEMIYV